MKNFIKLLLLAAVTLPWVGATAQTEASGQEVTTSPERTDVTKVNTVGWQELFQDKSPDLAKAAHSVQPAHSVAKVQTTASSADKKPVTNGHARKAPATPQNDGKRNAPAKAPRGAAKAPPTSATIEEWQIQTDWYDKAAGTSSSETGWVLGSFGRTTVNVAITSSTVYIQGLSKYFPDAWVEGTITSVVGTSATLFEGQTKVTFSSGQLYGTDDEGVSHYFVGEWKESQDTEVWFWYDATNGTLSQHIQSDDDGNPIYNYICEGTTATDINGFGYHEGTVLTKIVNRPMKTLSEAEIRALENIVEDGQDMFHYKYPINVSNPTKTGTLLDNVVVTDGESAGHAIALLRAVYTNKYLPGPYYRGFTSANVEEGSVDYSAVGSVTASGIDWTYSSGSYTVWLTDIAYENTAGWNIEPKSEFLTGMSPSSGYEYFYINGDKDYYYQRCQYATFNPIDYRPNEEGYTLLLVEVQDNFKTSDIWDKDANNGEGAYRVFSSDPYENLVQYVLKTIKSVRLLTEATRTGTNTGQGTLFKIDANSLNRFFIISKGQARKYNNSYYATNTNFDFCEAPYFGLYKIKNQDAYDFKYNDDSCEPIFYHMFEQFSPSAANSGTAKADIYKTLVTGLDATGTDKTGFPVYHDCLSVPFAECDVIDATTGEGSGHEFKMLGKDDPITNAPDVRDLLFFVPDHRMTYHTNTTFPDGNTYSRDYALFNNDNTIIQSFIYYNQDYAPRMDMYVIRLNPIEGEQMQNEQGQDEHVYQLKLNWKSNMSSFLPAEEQKFTLWRVVTDANGSTEYQPVYRVNEKGLYVDKNGEELSDQNDVSKRVAVEMEGIYSLNELDYYDYVPMDATGKEVTYAVRGQDTGEFLSLQYSNSESYLIPGYDKNVRLTLKIDSDNYSKFDLLNENNNYWNQLAVANNKGTSVTVDLLKARNVSTPGTTIYFKRWDTAVDDSEGKTIATAEVTNIGNNSVTFAMTYFDQVEFEGSKYAENKNSYTFTYPTESGVINFEKFNIYDNFKAKVSKNDHPGRYVYRAYFKAAQMFTLDDGSQSDDVYSNERAFKVFKTNPSVNSALSLQNVLDDTDMSIALTDNSKYKIEVEQTSKSLLWRYEVCRWASTPPDEFTYFGDAQNQDEEGYSLSFGNDSFNYTDNVSVGNDVEFEDKELKENGGAYSYVPQAVVYTKRTDNNTYGAPRKTNAIGKLQVSLVDEAPLMSDYWWKEGDTYYSYYSPLLKFEALDVPDGYELYKVRAWREVINPDPDILKEECQSREGRSAAKYLYEDLNSGDYLDCKTINEDGTISPVLSNMSYSTLTTYELGCRSTEYGVNRLPHEDNIRGEVRATFGAKRLKTDEDPNHGSINELDVDFVVRAYFTKKTNPMIFNNPTTKPIYVVQANSYNPTDADYTAPLATLYSNDGETYTGTFTATALSDDDPYCYFNFTKVLGSTRGQIQDYLFGAEWNEQGAIVNIDNSWINHDDKVFNLRYWGNDSRIFKIAPGTYKLSITWHKQDKTAGIDYFAGNMKVSTTSRGEVVTPGSDYDFYMAEGKYQLRQNGTGVITGISGVKMDVNREVVGVSYVNTIGQVSSTPWQGVNMVVTRYSDGSTTTRKVIK